MSNTPKIDELLAKYGNYSTVKKDWDKFEGSEHQIEKAIEEWAK